MADAETLQNAGFVLAAKFDDGKTEIWDRGGVPWHKAQKPRRWHRCKTQTIGWMDWYVRIERCACGAIRMGGHVWVDRNSRK